MVGGWTLILLLFAALDWRGRTQDCWESCFGPENRIDEYKDEYREIYELISNMRSISATPGGTGTGASNGTAFLLDTSIPSSESDDKQTLVLELSRKLSQILAFSISATTSFNPLFFIKFDGTRSWYCYEWACLGRCDAYTKLETEYDKFSAESATSTMDLLDDSCKAAANVMDIDQENADADNHIQCHQYTFNEMVIAFVNSPLQIEESIIGCANQERSLKDAINDLDGRGGFDEFLPTEDETGFGNWCDRKFTKRAVVGTLKADEDEMESFASVNSGNWAGSSYLREDEDLLAAAEAIATCMNDQCCPPSGGSDRRKRQAVGDTCVEYKNSALNSFSPS